MFESHDRPCFLFLLFHVYFQQGKGDERERDGSQVPPSPENICNHSCFCGFEELCSQVQLQRYVRNAQ